MPFAGDVGAARSAIATLLTLHTGPGDELILADNSGVAPATGGVEIVPAPGERSPAHARNAGAERARNEWILFLDADCRAPAALLDAFFAEPIADRVGAIAGEVVPALDGQTVAARYGAARSFLGQDAHLAHPFRPRAAAANLLVRRAAFEQIGGFYEGLRAAEDTDFSWRLQDAGWRLELRPQAQVEHRYRTTLRELRRQWRGYAAGRAWLARRYEEFEPEPAVARASRRARSRVSRAWHPRRATNGPRPRADPAAAARAGPLERGRYLAIDALLAADELAGFALSNRPDQDRAGADVVLVAERFPAAGDPLVDFALSLDMPRVEATGRPESLAAGAARALTIDYREDDGVATRAVALALLVARHPVRCVLDLLQREQDDPPLTAIAPAVRRLARDPAARVHALGPGEAQATARRLAALAGRRLTDSRRP
jgi:hypothetical protein